MKNAIFLIISLIFSFPVNAQINWEQSYNIPTGDCEAKMSDNFEYRSILLVLPDDSTGLSEKANWIIEKEKKKKRDVLIVLKLENELTEADMKKSLWFLGKVHSFKNWEKYDIPVFHKDDGVSINSLLLRDSLDGFSYISPIKSVYPRMLVSGNSLQAILDMESPEGVYQFTSYNKKVLKYFGNLPDSIVDANIIRETAYNRLETEYYIFFISKNLSEEETQKASKEILEKYDRHAATFIDKMELVDLEDKIHCYIHANQYEISTMTGFFTAFCYGATIHGFVTGKDIHSVGMGNAIEHESNHIIFNRINNNIRTFFSEGIQKWYEYSNDSKLRTAGIAEAKKYIDETRWRN